MRCDTRGDLCSPFPRCGDLCPVTYPSHFVAEASSVHFLPLAVATLPGVWGPGLHSPSGAPSRRPAAPAVGCSEPRPHCPPALPALPLSCFLPPSPGRKAGGSPFLHHESPPQITRVSEPPPSSPRFHSRGPVLPGTRPGRSVLYLRQPFMSPPGEDL